MTKFKQVERALANLEEMRPRVEALGPNTELDPADLTHAISASRDLDLHVERIDGQRKWLFANGLPTKYRP